MRVKKRVTMFNFESSSDDRNAARKNHYGCGHGGFLSVNARTRNVSEPRLSSALHTNCELVPQLQRRGRSCKHGDEAMTRAFMVKMNICDCAGITLCCVQLQSRANIDARDAGARLGTVRRSAIVLETNRRMAKRRKSQIPSSTRLEPSSASP
jgi:hypothetical protein